MRLSHKEDAGRSFTLTRRFSLDKRRLLAAERAAS